MQARWLQARLEARRGQPLARRAPTHSPDVSPRLPAARRGVVLEALGRFDEAITDYRAVLAVAPNDPAAWNNLGNASAGKGDWCGQPHGAAGGRAGLYLPPPCTAPRSCCGGGCGGLCPAGLVLTLLGVDRCRCPACVLPG